MNQDFATLITIKSTLFFFSFPSSSFTSSVTFLLFILSVTSLFIASTGQATFNIAPYNDQYYSGHQLSDIEIYAASEYQLLSPQAVSAEGAIAPLQPPPPPPPPPLPPPPPPPPLTPQQPPESKRNWSSVIRKIRESLDVTKRLRSKRKISPRTQSQAKEERTFYIEVDPLGKPKGMAEIISLSKFDLGHPSPLSSCNIYGQPMDIEDRLKKYSSAKPIYVNSSQMEVVLAECGQYFSTQMTMANSTTKDDSKNNETSSKTKGGLIGEIIPIFGNVTFPGTLWCGPGRTAKNYYELGSESDVDACCRDHDHCDDAIVPGESKYGLSNTGSYTKSNCDCDHKFYQCLKAVDSLTAKLVGMTFFNIVAMECFKMEYPVVACVKYSESGIFKKCSSYLFDLQKPKVYQFFHLNTF